MAGDVERRPCLSWISARGFGGIVDLAGRVHRAGAHQHVVIAQFIVDGGDQFGAAALRADIIAGGHERAGQQTASGQSAIVSRPLAEPFRVDGPRLGTQDHAIDAGEFAQFRQRDGFDDGALGFQDALDIFQRGGDIRMRRHIRFMKMTHEADTQPGHAAVERRAEVAARWSGRCPGRADRARRALPAATRCRRRCGSSGRHGPA